MALPQRPRQHWKGQRLLGDVSGLTPVDLALLSVTGVSSYHSCLKELTSPWGDVNGTHTSLSSFLPSPLSTFKIHSRSIPLPSPSLPGVPAGISFARAPADAPLQVPTFRSCQPSSREPYDQSSYHSFLCTEPSSGARHTKKSKFVPRSCSWLPR